MISGLVSIDRPCSEYSGKTTGSVGRHVATRLGDQRADAIGLSREIRLCDDDGILDLLQPDDQAIGRLVESAKSAQRFLRRLIYPADEQGACQMLIHKRRPRADAFLRRY